MASLGLMARFCTGAVALHIINAFVQCHLIPVSFYLYLLLHLFLVSFHHFLKVI